MVDNSTLVVEGLSMDLVLNHVTLTYGMQPYTIGLCSDESFTEYINSGGEIEILHPFAS